MLLLIFTPHSEPQLFIDTNEAALIFAAISVTANNKICAALFMKIFHKSVEYDFIYRQYIPEYLATEKL